MKFLKFCFGVLILLATLCLPIIAVITALALPSAFTGNILWILLEIPGFPIILYYALEIYPKTNLSDYACDLLEDR